MGQERQKVQRPHLTSHAVANTLVKPVIHLLVDITFGKRAEQAMGEAPSSSGTVGVTS